MSEGVENDWPERGVLWMIYIQVRDPIDIPVFYDVTGSIKKNEPLSWIDWGSFLRVFRPLRDFLYLSVVESIYNHARSPLRKVIVTLFVDPECYNGNI